MTRRIRYANETMRKLSIDNNSISPIYTEFFLSQSCSNYTRKSCLEEINFFSTKEWNISKLRKTFLPKKYPLYKYIFKIFLQQEKFFLAKKRQVVT